MVYQGLRSCIENGGSWDQMSDPGGVSAPLSLRSGSTDGVAVVVLDDLAHSDFSVAIVHARRFVSRCLGVLWCML